MKNISYKKVVQVIRRLTGIKDKTIKQVLSRRSRKIPDAKFSIRIENFQFFCGAIPKVSFSVEVFNPKGYKYTFFAAVISIHTLKGEKLQLRTAKRVYETSYSLHTLSGRKGLSDEMENKILKQIAEEAEEKEKFLTES